MNSRKHSNNSYSNKKQSGLTLVEIIVSMTISLLLLAGVFQIYRSSQNSYNLQSGVARLQENARYALDIMARNIGQAGYTNNVIPITAFNIAATMENASPISGVSIANGVASDTISINYQVDSAIPTDCLGNLIGPTGSIATELYFLDGTDLMCLGNGDPTPGVLAEGIESMQILYGQDTNGDGVANRFVSADNIVAANPVSSIRIAYLISTVDPVGGTDSKVYSSLLNTAPIGPIEDSLRRQVYTRSIILRNRAVF